MGEWWMTHHAPDNKTDMLHKLGTPTTMDTWVDSSLPLLKLQPPRSILSHFEHTRACVRVVHHTHGGLCSCYDWNRTPNSCF